MYTYYVVLKADRCSILFEGASRSDCEWFMAREKFRDVATQASDCEIVEIKHSDFWDIEDVKLAAPDLTRDQCREVLQRIGREYGAGALVDFETLEYLADHIRKGR